MHCILQTLLQTSSSCLRSSIVWVSTGQANSAFNLLCRFVVCYFSWEINCENIAWSLYVACFKNKMYSRAHHFYCGAFLRWQEKTVENSERRYFKINGGKMVYDKRRLLQRCACVKQDLKDGVLIDLFSYTCFRKYEVSITSDSAFSMSISLWYSDKSIKLSNYWC